MCEKRHCTHSPEELCSCAPVRSGDVLQTAAHVAESMMDINWELDYKSLADLGDYRLCLIGKCRQCGGRLCVSQYPVDAQTPEDFLAAVYRRLNQFHRRLDADLSRPAFHERFAAMFHKEDRLFVENWLARREMKIGDEARTRKVYTIVHTAAYADRGDFPLPDAIGTFFDKKLAENRLRELVEKEKTVMSFPYDESLYLNQTGIQRFGAPAPGTKCYTHLCGRASPCHFCAQGRSSSQKQRQAWLRERPDLGNVLLSHTLIEYEGRPCRLGTVTDVDSYIAELSAAKSDLTAAKMLISCMEQMVSGGDAKCVMDKAAQPRWGK